MKTIALSRAVVFLYLNINVAVNKVNNVSKQSLVLEKLNQISFALELLDVQAQPPAVQAYNYQMPFALDTMSLEQWLYFVYIPRVKQSVLTEDYSLLTQLEGFSYVFEHHLTDAKYTQLVATIKEYETSLLAIL